MSELDGHKLPDAGGEECYRDEATPVSSMQRTPHNPPPSGDLSVQNLFGNPNLRSETPPTAARTELQKNMADIRMRDFQARKRKSMELQLSRFLQDRRLSVFSNDDKVSIMANANAEGSDAVEYLQQREEHIKILFDGDASEIDMLNTIEKMLSELPAARKTAHGSTDYSSEAVDRVGTQFVTMVDDIVTFGVDPEEDLVALQGSLQALYVKNISTLEGASIKERWATAELTKLKGQVKEAHSRANCVIKQAKKEKMKALAKNKIDRKETRVYNLIDNVDISANKVNSEESAVFVESVGGLLNSENHTLDTEIDDLAVLDRELASRAEKLRCAASASAMKAMSSVRRYRNEDGAASKCSAGSFVPRSKPTAGGATEDRLASNAPPPKSDAQKSREASEPLFAKKKPTSGKERRKRYPSPPSDEDDSSSPEEEDGSSSEDAKGYDRDRRQYNEDRRRWQENTQHNPPRDGGGR